MSFHSYTRVKKLGSGSFGSVFLVQCKSDGKYYVQKEIDLGSLPPQGRKDALREVKFLSQLRHKNVIQYKEFFQIEPEQALRTGSPSKRGTTMLYIVMEYADGGDIDKLIKRQSKENPSELLSESHVLRYFVQIVMGLQHVHSRKILHRDIKSENIFLMSDGRCCIGDFGISKSLASTMAHAMTRIGTPYYLSPEICMSKPYNVKSDMWALGVLLYELMALKHPFDSTSMAGLLAKITKSQPAPLPKCYSTELRMLCESLLSKDPKMRPSIGTILKMSFLQSKIEEYNQKYGANDEKERERKDRERVEEDKKTKDKDVISRVPSISSSHDTSVPSVSRPPSVSLSSKSRPSDVSLDKENLPVRHNLLRGPSLPPSISVAPSPIPMPPSVSVHSSRTPHLHLPSNISAVGIAPIKSVPPLSSRPSACAIAAASAVAAAAAAPLVRQGSVVRQGAQQGEDVVQKLRMELFRDRMEKREERMRQVLSVPAKAAVAAVCDKDVKRSTPYDERERLHSQMRMYQPAAVAARAAHRPYNSDLYRR